MARPLTAQGTALRVHLADMARVRTRKVCELEDREVSTSEISKGYEISRDHIVPVTDEELRDLPLPTAKAIEIVAFMPLSSIDPIRICVQVVNDRSLPSPRPTAGEMPSGTGHGMTPTPMKQGLPDGIGGQPLKASTGDTEDVRRRTLGSRRRTP
ncbi:hypothetical protein JRC61_32665 [Streptomyces sp. CL12-4]|nr:hypothetical protein [Streptomyces sp. CL12-4]